MTMLSSITTAVSTMLLGATLAGPSTPNPVASMNHEVRSVNKAVGKHGDFMRICKTVRCSPEQRAELRAVGANFREVAKPLRAQQREIRRELVAAFSKDTLDDRTLAQLYQRLDRVNQQIMSARRDALEDAHGLLSPEQRDDVAKILAGGKKRRGKGKAKNAGKNKGKNKGKHLAKGQVDMDDDIEADTDRARSKRRAKADRPERKVKARGKGKSSGELSSVETGGEDRAERKRQRRVRKDRRAERLAQPRGSSPPPTGGPEQDLRPAR